VPFTTLCATFFAVIAVLFATFLAVRTGPASTLLTAIAKPSMIEKNAFILLKVSLLRPRVRSFDVRLLICESARNGSSGRIRTYDPPEAD
jgi:hypothetical protein